MSEQRKPQTPCPYGLTYGGVVLREDDLIAVCQELVDGVDPNGLRAMYAQIGDAEDFVACIGHALTFHTNAIVSSVRSLAALREREGHTIQ